MAELMNPCSQGGVKSPTGGIPHKGQPASACYCRVSRSGEIPGPTVKVRMEEEIIHAVNHVCIFSTRAVL